jgi:hypothetical protein
MASAPSAPLQLGHSSTPSLRQRMLQQFRGSEQKFDTVPTQYSTIMQKQQAKGSAAGSSDYSDYSDESDEAPAGSLRPLRIAFYNRLDSSRSAREVEYVMKKLMPATAAMLSRSIRVRMITFHSLLHIQSRKSCANPRTWPTLYNCLGGALGNGIFDIKLLPKSSPQPPPLCLSQSQLHQGDDHRSVLIQSCKHPAHKLIARLASPLQFPAVCHRSGIHLGRCHYQITLMRWVCQFLVTQKRVRHSPVAKHQLRMHRDRA